MVVGKIPVGLRCNLYPNVCLNCIPKSIRDMVTSSDLESFKEMLDCWLITIKDHPRTSNDIPEVSLDGHQSNSLLAWVKLIPGDFLHWTPSIT